MRIENSLLHGRCNEKKTFELDGSLGNHKVAPDYMNGVASTVAVIAIGLFSSESFRFGSLVGLAHLIIKIVPVVLFSRGENERSKFSKEIMEENAFDTGVAIPVLEETIFRLGLQTSLRSLFTMTLPSSIVVLPFGIALSSAAIGAILVSSAIFGAVHLSNEHDSVVTQALSAFSGGLVKGYLMEVDGFVAACAAHIVNNAGLIVPIKVCLAAFGESDQATDSSSVEVDSA